MDGLTTLAELSCEGARALQVAAAAIQVVGQVCGLGCVAERELADVEAEKMAYAVHPQGRTVAKFAYALLLLLWFLSTPGKATSHTSRSTELALRVCTAVPQT